MMKKPLFNPSQPLADARAYIKQRGAYVQGADKAMFHLSSPIGWINDPNGFSAYGGKIHLFFQHYPFSPKWGSMHWGHVVTDDLVRWQLLPEALAPDQAYEDGCFSGSALQVEDRHILIYTSHRDFLDGDGKPIVQQSQSMAWGNGVDYEKYENNPVLRSDQLPPGASAVDFREPKVWREDRVFRMIVGSCCASSGGQALLYESEDLIHWRYVCTVDQSRHALGEMWECVDFFELDGQWILLTSPMAMPRCIESGFHGQHDTVCIIGSWNEKEKTFQRSRVGCVDAGWDFYAPQTTLLPDGRRMMIAWMQSWDNPVTPPEQQWSGMMTFPRELRIVRDRLYQLPAKEIERYYTSQRAADGIADQSPVLLDSGRHLDCTLTLSDARDAVFQLSVAVGAGYAARLLFDLPAGTVTLDRTDAGMSNDLIPVHTVRLQEVSDTLKIQILLDLWSMEVFLQDGAQAITSLLYTPQSAQDIVLQPITPVRYHFVSHHIEVE